MMAANSGYDYHFRSSRLLADALRNALAIEPLSWTDTPVDFEQITLTRDNSIAVITLNRPEKLNAYTRQMGSEINDAVRAADQDDQVRSLILTGEGRAFFCAGADISPDGGIFGAPDPAGIAPVENSSYRCSAAASRSSPPSMVPRSEPDLR